MATIDSWYYTFIHTHRIIDSSRVQVDDDSAPGAVWITATEMKAIYVAFQVGVHFNVPRRVTIAQGVILILLWGVGGSGSFALSRGIKGRWY